jgi:hypothetical protein
MLSANCHSSVTGYLVSVQGFCINFKGSFNFLKPFDYFKDSVATAREDERFSSFPFLLNEPGSFAHRFDFKDDSNISIEERSGFGFLLGVWKLLAICRLIDNFLACN